MTEPGRRKWIGYSLRCAVVLVPLSIIGGLAMGLAIAYLHMAGIALLIGTVLLAIWAWPRFLERRVYLPLDRRFLHRPA
jgi:hypothetical protein